MAMRVLMFVVVCLVFSGNGFAQSRFVPVPHERPVQFPSSAAAEVENDVIGGTSGRCLQRLAKLGVRFRAVTPWRTKKGCGVDDPVEISSITRGASVLKLPSKPILSCRFGERLAAWMSDVVVPIAVSFKDSALTSISSGPGYVCRSRNNRRGAKLSEHAFGNALDITDFRFANGKRVAVSKSLGGAAVDRRMLKALRTSSCGYFTTVLGPGANAAHASHFHLDYGKHGRTWNYRICQ